jgi:hypothetical protein
MIYIGETRELDNDNSLPSIMELINKPIKEKEKVLRYMKKCRIDAVAPAKQDTRSLFDVGRDVWMALGCDLLCREIRHGAAGRIRSACVEQA